MPLIQCSPKASPTRALLAAVGPARDRAVEELANAFRARSAIGPAQSAWNTWTKWHKTWWGNEEYLPLTVDAVVAAAAMAKQGGYRSFSNYLSAAKERHILAGHAWTSQLAWEAKRCLRAVTRGIGPSKQAATLDMLLLSNITDDEVATDIGPARPATAALLGCWFMVREIELAAARVSHWQLQLSPPRILWMLPVSKTDPMALGAERAWGCLCHEFHTNMCPFHRAAQRLQWIQEWWSNVPAQDMPLFPDSAGETPSKPATVGALRRVAQACGHDSACLLNVIGRSLRVTGAKFLASQGLEVRLIQLLARWRSRAVDRYIGEAPLDSLAARFVSARQALRNSEMPRASSTRIGFLARQKKTWAVKKRGKRKRSVWADPAETGRGLPRPPGGVQAPRIGCTASYPLRPATSDFTWPRSEGAPCTPLAEQLFAPMTPKPVGVHTVPLSLCRFNPTSRVTHRVEESSPAGATKSACGWLLPERILQGCPPLECRWCERCFPRGRGIPSLRPDQVGNLGRSLGYLLYPSSDSETSPDPPIRAA